MHELVVASVLPEQIHPGVYLRTDNDLWQVLATRGEKYLWVGGHKLHGFEEALMENVRILDEVWLQLEAVLAMQFVRNGAL